MAVKSTKEKKTATPKNGVVKAEKSSKTSSRKNDDDEEEEDAHASDEDDDLDETDDWGKTEEEDDSWDPDFAEFDLPKTSKKAGKAKKGEDDDFGLEEEKLLSRIAFVDFDGSEALKLISSKDFSQENSLDIICPQIVKGVSLLKEWIKSQ